MRRTLRTVGAIAAIAGLAGAIWYFVSDEAAPAPHETGLPAARLAAPTPDPREQFATPYRNVKPGVKYVGDAACAVCHTDIDKSYHAHPMGRSAAWTRTAPAIEKYDAGAKNPIAAQGYEIAVTSANGTVRHAMRSTQRPDLPPYDVSSDVAIGSGAHGRSYLTIDAGSAWQSPASWYTNGAHWDVSPGYDLAIGARRPVRAECLFCHVDRVEPLPGSANRFREPLFPIQASIGCERCHGPGELHCQERENGVPAAKPDTSLVNPKDLPLDLKLDVCRQCHLQGQSQTLRPGRQIFEFRPGLPLAQFIAVYTKHPDLGSQGTKSVGQFEQMVASACFQGGKLDCTSCHDPHMKPAAASADAHYRTRCLNCHENRGCNAPQPLRAAKNDSCMTCHMPRGDSASIVHASVTDHTVARKPKLKESPKRASADVVPLLAFRPGPHAPPADAQERDLGIALARLGNAIPAGPDGVRSLVMLFAEKRLTPAIVAHPDDADAWLGLSMVASHRGELRKALALAKNAIVANPTSDYLRNGLAEAALAADDLPLALEVTSQLVEQNPRAPDYLHARAEVKLRLRDWAGAEADCRAALAIHPLIPKARLLLAAARLHQNDPAGAKAEAEVADALATAPGAKAAFRDWFARQRATD